MTGPSNDFDSALTRSQAARLLVSTSEPSISLRMYSSGLSSNDSSSASVKSTCIYLTLGSDITKYKRRFRENEYITPLFLNHSKITQVVYLPKYIQIHPLFTSELHVWHNNFLTNAAQSIWIFKQILVAWSFCHRGQELYCVTHELCKRNNQNNVFHFREVHLNLDFLLKPTVAHVRVRQRCNSLQKEMILIHTKSYLT